MSDFENTLKKLLKNKQLSNWQNSLEDADFVDFLKNYHDNHFNSVYHLLFKGKLSGDEVYQVNLIVELLISKDVPVFRMNDKNLLPDKMAIDQSVFAAEVLRKQIDLEHFKQLELELDQD